MKTINVNGHTIDWQEGMVIQDVLRIMNYTFKMLVIKIDGKLVPKDAYGSTLVPEGATVHVIHLISGG